MRILTVRQPWAWAIIHGGKTVENRVRNIAGSYRGPVLIHAAKVNDVDAWRAMGRTNLAAYGRALDARESLIGGSIIGVVDLVDAHHWANCMNPVDPADESTWAACSPWAEALNVYHLVFENPRALDEPMPYRGGLGLRRADFEVVGDYLTAPWGHPAKPCTPYGCEPFCELVPVGILTAVTS